MTKEEAIKILKELPNNVLGVVLQFDIDFDYTQALDIAINALEQETVSKESYDHEYFLRKELELEIYKLQRQLEEQTVKTEPILDKIKDYINHIKNTGMGKKKSLEFIEKYIDGLKAESEG